MGPPGPGPMGPPGPDIPIGPDICPDIGPGPIGPGILAIDDIGMGPGMDDIGPIPIGGPLGPIIP